MSLGKLLPLLCPHFPICHPWDAMLSRTPSCLLLLRRGCCLWLFEYLSLDLPAYLISLSWPLGSQGRCGCLWRARHPWTTGKEHFPRPAPPHLHPPRRPQWSYFLALASNWWKRYLCPAGEALDEAGCETLGDWNQGCCQPKGSAEGLVLPLFL